ncbi:MAG: glycosyltransferase [Sphingobacteriales bacterium]|nr:MAG: glycosyltransferase [Sphingobacteriales bacterium]
MKITIIGSAHPLRGGLATFNERLALALQEQGHDVVMYSFSLQYPSFLFPGKTQLTDEPAPENIKIHTAINSVNPLNWLSVGNRIKNERPDLILIKYWLPFMGPAFGTILRQVRKNRHTRVLCIVDNIIPHEKRPGDTAFTKYFVKTVDAFLTMSRDVLEDLKLFTTKPKVYHPHPLYDNYGPGVSKEEACRKLGVDSNKKYILFFGFIRKYKGLDILFEAMKDERIRAAGIELIVAGEYYGDQEMYEQLVVQYQIKNQLHLFTDFIPNSEVRYYFSAADLVVQPYRSATQSGITQIAYHFEKPMVVTNVGGLAEGVPDGKVGFVTEPYAKDIADAILKFYQPNALPALQENLLEEKRKYSWESFTKTLFSTVFNDQNKV